MIHARHQCEDFFGLYRRAALVGSGLALSLRFSARTGLRGAAPAV